MNNEAGYKEQKNLSSVQLLAEVPTLVETLLSAVFSGALLLYVDLLDSLGYIIRYALLIILSKKLSKNLKYEYNYGIGKIEAIASLLCDGIVLFGMFLTVCISIYSFFFPSKPSDLLIGVAGFKLYDIMWDLAFFVKQRKISKEHNVKVGFVRRENGSAKWVYIGSRCTNCGVLASYLDWKINYEPTDEMESNI